MPDEDAILMKEFRKKLGVKQADAGKILGCSQVLIAMIERGWNAIVRPRRKRMEEAVAVFESGGMEAVKAMEPFTYVRQRHPRREPPPGDREEMKIWRKNSGLSIWDCTEELGISVHSIRAIERGHMRISDRVRENMRRGQRPRKEEPR